MPFLGSQLNKKPSMIWSQGLCSAAALAEDFQGDMFQYLGHQEAGRSQSQLQPLPDRKRNRGSLALLLHGGPLGARLLLCLSHCPTVLSTHVPSPSVDPHSLVFHDGEPESKKVCPMSHSRKAREQTGGSSLGPSWALGLPPSRARPFPHTSFKP